MSALQQPDKLAMFRQAWMALAAICGHVLAIAPLVRASQLDRPGLLLACAVYFVVFGFLLHAIESLFYFERRILTARLWFGGIGLFVLTGVIAATLIPRTTREFTSIFTAVRPWLAEDVRGAVFNVGYASICFMVTYCVIGSATWPFVREYYEESDLDLGLRVPSGPTVILLQLSRGLLATLALLPLLAGTGGQAQEFTTWAYLVLTLSVTFAIMPMITAPKEWPTALRFAHGVEICAFVLIQGFAWWFFLAR